MYIIGIPSNPYATLDLAKAAVGVLAPGVSVPIYELVLASTGVGSAVVYTDAAAGVATETAGSVELENG